MGAFRRIRVVVALGLLAALTALPAAASPGTAGTAHIFGVVPTRAASALAPQLPTGIAADPAAAAAGNNLSYHGGPVMHTNNTYAIYWLPSGYTMSTNYAPLLNRYLGDVAAASGVSTNVYAAGTQYYDTAGPIVYSSTFAGSYTDTTTPIPNDCSGYRGTGVSVTGCVTDSDLQAEVSRVLARTGWTAGSTNEFFVFTPRNVGSCFDSSTNECSYTYYCAYHNDFSSGGRDVIYANQPYTDSSGVNAPGACSPGQFPNNDWADATINVLSHEHNESITDPDGDAWFDSSGDEDGDKCAWTFGDAVGSTPYGEYNQVINGDFYYLQREWSNATSSCVLNYSTLQAQAPTVSGFAPGSGTVGTSVTISGANFTGATSVTFNGASASFTVGSSTSITATVPSTATTGPIKVTGSAGTGTSTSSFTVLPSIASFTPASGTAGTNVTITGGGLSGTSSVSFNGVASTNIHVNSATSVSATVPNGATTGPIRVATPSGSATSASSFTVTTVTGKQDFSLSVSPASQNVTRGQSVTFTITITPINGFSAPVTLSVGGLPGGVTASFSPNPATTTSTLTVTTALNTGRGNHSVDINGTSGGLHHNVHAGLNIQ